MSAPLLKIEIKLGYKLLLLFMGILTLYASIITAMYDPQLGAGINALAESMPEFFAVFGMQNPGVTLLDFLINYLYGFILILIPLIYGIIMCHRLAARYVDRGSMAYLLNSHYSRGQILGTQIFVLLSGLLILGAYGVVLLLLCSHFLFPGELAVPEFLVLNLGLLSLEIFLASFCFLFASLFNEIKYSIGLGAGISALFFLIQMLSQVSEEARFLKYFTPLTLFSPEQLIQYEAPALLRVILLLALAAIFFTAAWAGFKKRDLPL